ncbi:MAG: 30S ribosomal protein S6 [Deltaproteobacteria bacterium]|nr:30S ribosomal protein S6 [Deltaproteobacteria bacterium]
MTPVGYVALTLQFYCDPAASIWSDTGRLRSLSDPMTWVRLSAYTCGFVPLLKETNMAGISKDHLREYETLFVLNPDIDDETAVEFITKMKTLVGEKEGTHLSVTNWGRKKLAWDCNRHQKGMFVHHQYLGGNILVKEYERILGIEEMVLLRQTKVLSKHIVPGSKEPGEDIIAPPVTRSDRREERAKAAADGDAQPERTEAKPEAAAEE